MKDRSLEEVDVLKLVIYVFSFISVCTALILFVMLPILKDYKQTSARFFSQKAILDNVNNTLKFHEDKLNTLKIDNNISFAQFDTKFDKNSFKNFIYQYFNNVKITNLKIDNNEKYLKEKLQISATMNNQARFYLFMDSLKKYTNLIKITYPMVIDVKNNKIIINFKAEIYSAK